jgi:tRNA threonylcarbamoyladenosine biosynthesis protein TsaB
MTILALEFSSSQRSVAVARAGVVLAETGEAGGRATNALGMIGRVLAEAKIAREEIEAMVVGLGPGSYTGIRAAIAVAQGWQLARGVKLLGLSSVTAIAVQAQAEKIFGRVNVVIDAQRGEFYLAAYDVSTSGATEIKPLRIATLAEVQARSQAQEILIGPELAQWFPSGREIGPNAAMLARLAAERNDFTAGEDLTPVYLRETSFIKAPPARAAF